MNVKMRGSVAKLLAGTAVFLAFGTAATVGPQVLDLKGAAAWAQTDDGEGGQGGQGQGGQGEGGQGQGGQGGEGGQGEGQGGPGEDSDGQGPKAGSGGEDGGKPVWADSDVDEVELGRLNVARSPDSVLDRAFDEALASVTPEMIAFYNLSTAEMIEVLAFEFDSAAYIDSPLQNLALLRDALEGGTALADLGVTTDIDTMMAIYIAVAADKEGEGISAATVTALTTILGHPITGAEAEALAAKAEAIRLAIVEGHG